MINQIIKDLRQDFIDTEQELWSNFTISIAHCRFKVEYSYENISSEEYSSYVRHVIWRYNILGVSLEQCTREEREIIKRYQTGVKKLNNQEEYETGVYIKNVKNIVDYTTPSYDNNAKDIEYMADEEKYSNRKKNMIFLQRIMQKQEVVHTK